SLGGWVTYGGQVGEDACEECLKVAYEHGINFFDNAEVYAGGKSEIAMGKAIKKFGWKRGGDGVNEKGLSRKLSVEGPKAAWEHSLSPMEEIVRAFNWVIEKGWAFYWGTSEWSAEQISDAHRVADKLGLIGPLMEQPQYNAFSRERFEKEYAPLYEKYGMGTTIWSPLASGILTGKYNHEIPSDSRLGMKENALMQRIAAGLETPEGKEKIEKVKKLMAVAAKLECTVAQLALAWCVKNPNVSTVITGASRPSQVVENVKSLSVVPKLTASVMEEIEAILDNKPKADILRY
ncbi:hypothetical protein HDU76_001941, partial [Blyttiomyces sp. JEL0837]